jgi:hypothetical protein
VYFYYFIKPFFPVSTLLLISPAVPHCKRRPCSVTEVQQHLGLSVLGWVNWHLEGTQRITGMAAMSALNPLFNLRSPLTTRTRLLLYNTLIRSTMTYASHWHQTTTSHTKQGPQNHMCMYYTTFYTNPTKLHITNNILALPQYIRNLTENDYYRIEHNHNNLINTLGNYSFASLAFKYKHKLLKHVLL